MTAREVRGKEVALGVRRNRCSWERRKRRLASPHSKASTLPVDEPLIALAVARAGDGFGGERCVEALHFGGRQGDLRGGGVFLEVGPALGAGDGDDVLPF